MTTTSTTTAPVREKSPDEQLSDATNVIRRQYYDTVRWLADDIKRSIEQDEITTREGLIERIDQDTDDHHWVIYTSKAQMVLLVSDNDDAYADCFGEDGMVSDGTINWSALASAALNQDVYDQLDAIGVDVNGETKAEMLKLDDDDDTDGDDD